jgi:hypothetical protein
MRRFPYLFVGLVALAAVVTGPTSAWSQDLDQFALLAGDSLAIRFEPVCASRVAGGDEVRAVVAVAKTSGNRVLIEEGTPVDVKVIETKSNGRPGKPGRIKLTVTGVLAADGAEIPLTLPPVEREGRGRNILSKILTLFLIKGTDPCILGDEVFYPKFPENKAVFLPRT